ncbi:hypothetical protein EAO70_35065, partial [Streptomyces sp. adm13(2018)]|uniref:hypothetical protein n=1 Tax=Streptomyces sp. adm13(2018) TaxID=2479007 RepID=UPI0013A4BD22
GRGGPLRREHYSRERSEGRVIGVGSVVRGVGSGLRGGGSGVRGGGPGITAASGSAIGTGLGAAVVMEGVGGRVRG